MYLDLYNKEDYEVTLDDFKKEVDKALQSLIGVDVMKNGGISKITKEAIEPALFSTIECDNTLLKIYCPALGDNDMETFGRINFSYKEDKRTHNKKSTKIKSIEFEYTIDTSKVDDYVCNISQVLTYDIAEQCKKDLEDYIKSHEAILDEKRKKIAFYEDIMKTEKYF